nr:SMP-30/gluconolactonase/LRE family protein [Allomuricauda sp.]
MKILLWGLLFISLGLTAQSKHERIPLSFNTDLIPEGIAIDPVLQKVYINSLKHNKIMRCNLDGSNTEEFLGANVHGYLPGFGMTIKGNTLYALGNSLPKPRNKSILLLLKASSGERIQSYPRDTNDFIYWNDIVISTQGKLYITDSESNNLYTLDAELGELKVYYSHDDIKHSNGIAISSDDRYLYLATYTTGIRILDLNTKELVNPPNNYKGIDGMKFHNDCLVAIVNSKRDSNLNGVYQFTLNKDLTGIQSEEKIWSLQDPTDIPTTFAIHDNAIYFVADSQLDMLDQQHNTITDRTLLNPYELIKLPID